MGIVADGGSPFRPGVDSYRLDCEDRGWKILVLVVALEEQCECGMW